MEKPAKPLKRYHRKKFFYRLFLRKSPRNAALFGLSWYILLLVSLPFVLMASIPPLLFAPDAGIIHYLGLGVIVLLLFLVFLYGLFTLGYAYSTMIRRIIPQRDAREAGAGLCALFYSFGGVLLFLVHFVRKRWFFAACSAASVVLVIVHWLSVDNFPLDPMIHWGIGWCGILLLLTAICGVRDRCKIRPFAFTPLALTILLLAGMWWYHAALQREIAAGRAEISQMLGRSIEFSDFWANQAKGFPLNEKPLSTLIATLPTGYSHHGDAVWSIADYQRELAEFEEENPEFCKAVWAMAELPPQSIKHAYTADSIAVLLLPELNTFRTAGQYLKMQLIANAGDRDKVLQYNRQLECIRDWCLVDFSLIAKLTGMSIEGTRLKALSYPLAQETLSYDDWKELLARRPDWGYVFADAVGDEATMFESTLDFAMFRQEDGLGALRKGLPLWCSIHFARDYRFALEEFKKLELFLAPETKEITAVKRTEWAKPDEVEIKEKLYFFSGMMLPSISTLHLKQAEVEDYYRLIEISVAVMDYRKAHGKLPETLDFLPDKPLDSLNLFPFRYEQGELQVMGAGREIHTRQGFRLYLRDTKGNDPGGLKAKNAFTVILP